MTDRIVVVGAGICGLTAATELADHAHVRIVERLPAPGGTWQFDHPAVERLVRECRAREVVADWGNTALRWQDHRLLIVGPGRREWVSADHLVFAGGTRPATPAEVPLFGARSAGVFAATVAHHLLEGRVTLGRRIILCGSGFWADLVLRELPAGTSVTRLSATGGANPPPGVTLRDLPGHRPVEVHGDNRVRELVVRSGGEVLVLPCDAIVLADGLRPLRNIDGAIDDAVDVTFVQPTAAALTASEAVEYARKSVAALSPKEPR